MISLGGQSEIFISIKTSYFIAVDDSSKEGGTVEPFLNFEIKICKGCFKSVPSIITRPLLDNGKLLHLHISCPVQYNSCPVKYFPTWIKAKLSVGGCDGDLV